MKTTADIAGLCHAVPWALNPSTSPFGMRGGWAGPDLVDTSIVWRAWQDGGERWENDDGAGAILRQRR